MTARENPYRSEEVLKIRYRFQDTTLSEILLRLQQLRFRAAIVGPEGSGKTTLLEDLQTPLAAQGKKLYWIRLTREFSALSRAHRERMKQGFGPDDIILFDGSEILGWFRFQLFRWKTRHAGGLLITTHQTGYLPTVLRTRTSAELLGEILQKLDPETPSAQIPMLHRKHHGNIRDALRDQYDYCMTRPSPVFSMPTDPSA